MLSLVLQADQFICLITSVNPTFLFHTEPVTNRQISSLQVYLSLLRMYLSPPDVHCLGPIKMELSEPQANLQAALHVLELHHSKLNTTKVSDSKSFQCYRLCQAE